MLSPDAEVTYAQYNEDIILGAILHNIDKGYYVDVGANHEEYHSVTKYFYNKGWNGINIEPIPRLIKEFNKKRPRDINLAVAVSNKKGSLELREYPEYDGFSTLSAESKNDPDKKELPYIDYIVPVDTLESIFAEHKVKKIDFLKIDVEGYESEVLQSNNWTKYRPTVICIEANHRISNWANLLLDNRYEKVIFDGLNEYYIAKESADIFKGYAERAAINAHNAIRNHAASMWKQDIQRIKFLENFTEKQDKHIKNIQKTLEDAKHLSFKDRKYLSRLKLTIKGLTVDYARFRLRK